MKLEVEKSVGYSPPIGVTLLALILSFFLCGLLTFNHEICVGMVGGYIVFLLVIGFADWIKEKTPLPGNAEVYAQAAIERFKHNVPNAQVVSVAVRDVNRERLIISVRYERAGVTYRSTPSIYYAVRRADRTVTLENGLKWRSPRFIVIRRVAPILNRHRLPHPDNS